MPYPVLAERWHDFYVVAGTSAATLVGLLFFGLSLHLRLVLSHVEVRGLARVTLANFGFLLFVSLLTVIHQDASAVGPQLIGAGAFSLAVIGPSLVSAVRSRTRTLPSIRLFLRFGLSGLGYMGVILAGVLLVEGDDRAALNLSWVVTVVLLFISLRSSWDLLVTVGEAAMRDES